MRAFELKANWSASYARIGEELGISAKQAEKDYKRACAEYGQESAADHKSKANSRFDGQLGSIARLVGVLRPLAEGRAEPGKSPSEWSVPPDLEAAARLSSLLRVQMQVTKAQAEMNGAYAPQVIEHKGTVDLTTSASPAKARQLLKDYFGGNVVVPESQPAGEEQPSRDRGVPTSH